MVVYKLADEYTLYKNDMGENFIMNRITNEKKPIGGSAPDIIALFDGERDMDDVLGEMCKMFGPSVEPYVLAQDLTRFVADLVEEGFLQYVKTKKFEFPTADAE